MNERLTSRAVLGMFAKGLSEVTTPAWVDAISWLNASSDQFAEEYRWLDQNPSFREWVGGRQAVQLGDNGVIVENRPYEATIQFHRRELRKDKTGQIQNRISTLLQATVGRHWQQLMTPLILNGETSVSTYGASSTYDGVDFFVRSGDATKHRDAQHNVVQTTGLSGGRPTVAQCEAALQLAIELMMGFTDDQGEPANEDLGSVVVMAPPSFIGAIAAALRLQVIQGTGGAIDNPIMAMGDALGFSWSLAANSRMNTTGWGTGSTRRMVIARTDHMVKPFIRQEAEPVSTSALAEGSEFEHMNNAHQYGVHTERGAGYGLWEHAVLAEFAA